MHPDTEPDTALLAAALRAAPRRYRLPPLPGDVAAARAADDDTAVAFAIEAVRLGRADDAVRALFIERLAALIRAALAAEGGDAAFQAMVLHARDPEVQHYVRLGAQGTADRRAVRAAINALAHPGKLRAEPEGARRQALLHLHQLTSADAWMPLARMLAAPPPPLRDLQAALAAVAESAALQRLLQREALLALPTVQQYHALCELRGPLAGSRAAAAQGRASARAGDAAEQVTLAAFAGIALRLDALTGGAPTHRVASSLRTPAGFPGEAGKAKDEWDAALVHQDAPTRPAHIVLLAEVKAAPAAATPDYSRLQRGLERLALADAHRGYVFPCAQGELLLAGASLRALRPQGRVLPPHVIYCCSAAPEPQPQMLSAASKAVLLAEPASLSFAQRLVQGENPDPVQLQAVWHALGHAERLRSALHQYDTARAAREAMLDPRDLLQALAS